MVNGSTIIEFQEKNFQRLWEQFVREKGIDVNKDVDTLFEQFPKLETAFDEFCAEQYGQGQDEEKIIKI